MVGVRVVDGDAANKGPRLRRCVDAQKGHIAEATYDSSRLKPGNFLSGIVPLSILIVLIVLDLDSLVWKG